MSVLSEKQHSLLSGENRIHQHCMSCIKVRACKQYEKCRIRKCINGCGFIFHECKLEEHKLLCKNEKVRCINAGNGCPFIMFRSETGKHLEACPASVIFCTSHWSRHLAHLGHQIQYFSYQKLGHGQLDADLLFRDHKKVCNILDVSGNCANVPGSSINIPVLYQDDSNSVTPDNLLESSGLYEIEEVDGEYWLKEVDDVPLPNSTHLAPAALIVGLGLEKYTGCLKDAVGENGVSSSDDKWTFSCVREFRRDEYIWHYKNVHSDILNGLNGWMEYRCPLLYYGCGYSVRRLHPHNKNACIVYIEELDSFTIKYHENEIQCSSQQVPNITQLPFEVLTHLCKFLDSFSLCNLAATCRVLHSVCFSILKQRGIVIEEWKQLKVGDEVYWRISSKRWIFSRGFSPVHSWVFGTEENMSNHLQHCPYNQRKKFKEKYYPVLPDSCGNFRRDK